ncbi:hypothetical protein DFH06DRAFT_1009088 [Mycena polygramma]|nr:hypothetical protein DFH06DRAFT_1009088 [Mycena polygramma]
MHPTVARSRYLARRPLQSFRANKDYYKGNRQSALVGHRTGAPGVHIGKRPGYRLLENKVRVFVAPPIDEILASPLKPYVAAGVHVPRSLHNGVFRGMPGPGLTPEHFLQSARKWSLAQAERQAEMQKQRHTPAVGVAAAAPAAAAT